MSAELRVKFLGEYPDARKAVAGLDRLLQVLGAVEGLTSRDATRSRWRFTELGLGSVAVSVALLKPRRGATADEAELAFRRTIDGLAEAEEREGMPAGWSVETAARARDLIKETEADGLLMELWENGRAIRATQVTRNAQRHLEGALNRGYRDSIGSMIGQLDRITVHEKREAWLWPERGGAAVPVQFEAEQLDLVKEHLGARVEASGWIRRDLAGQPVRLKLRDLDRLQTFDESPRLSDLIGLDPNFTGGKSAAEYLREVRGEAK